MSNPFANWTQAQVEAHNRKLMDTVSAIRRTFGKGDLDALEMERQERRKGVEKESELHNDIAAYCRSRGWLAFHGSMAQRSHRSLGEPDFTIFADAGRVFVVEAKTRNGKLRPEQLGVKVMLETLGHGHRYAVVRSMEDFLKLVL